MLKYTLAAITLMASSLFGGCGGCSEPCGIDCGCDTCCDPCNTCCAAPCCCEPCDFCPPCPPETCAYNAPKFYDIKCSWNMFLQGSFLYMQAKQENLDYLLTFESEITPVSDGSNFIKTIVSSPSFSFNFKPAMKLGFGLSFGCDNWDVYAEYFRYHGGVGSSSFSQTKTDGENITLTICPFFRPEGEFPGFSVNADSDWRLNIDMVDINLRRKYFVGKCLLMQPSFGVKFGWIDQKQTSNYVFTLPDGQSTQAEIQETLNAVTSSDSWAVGFKTGLDTEWTFCKNFRFFGNTSFAILYTDYDPVKLKLTGSSENTLDNSLSTTSQNNFSNSFCFLRPDAGIILGFGWGDYWCCNDWYFDVSAGYEFHTYWNQNVMPRVLNCTQDPSSLFGDLYLHGLIVTARLDF